MMRCYKYRTCATNRKSSERYRPSFINSDQNTATSFMKSSQYVQPARHRARPSFHLRRCSLCSTSFWKIKCGMPKFQFRHRAFSFKVALIVEDSIGDPTANEDFQQEVPENVKGRKTCKGPARAVMDQNRPASRLCVFLCCPTVSG
jgi:hypothetical protein